MSRRKGELSASQIDREFRHQVTVLASTVAEVEGGNQLEVAMAGLSVCVRHHSIMKDDERRLVYCFTEKADADQFRQSCLANTRGRGASWARWRPAKPKRTA
jgi:hypothetical protein